MTGIRDDVTWLSQHYLSEDSTGTAVHSYSSSPSPAVVMLYYYEYSEKKQNTFEHSALGSTGILVAHYCGTNVDCSRIDCSTLPNPKHVHFG